MADIFYRLADGRIWDVQKAGWLDSEEAEILTAAQNISITPDSPEHGGIIDLISAEGESDVEYLAITLAFYNYSLGELLMYSTKGIKEELKRLDEEYLTPRTLAGLSTGDAEALARWNEHEVKAQPLRQRLAELESE